MSGSLRERTNEVESERERKEYTHGYKEGDKKRQGGKEREGKKENREEAGREREGYDTILSHALFHAKKYGQEKHP